MRVGFLPRQKVLSAIIHQISVSQRAYPLMEVASMFFAREDACDVRVELQPAPDLLLYQCKACRAVSLEREGILRHMLAAHLEDYFERQEIVGDPPAGNFTCVARCRLSGFLLGPPNLHSYAEILKETHQTRFPDMPFDEYSRRIEILHDPALIEQWKEESRRQVLFRKKQAEGDEAQPVKRSVAEAFFLQHIAMELATRGHRAVLPRKIAASIKERSLRRAFVEAWRREKRFPASLMFALRGAFRNRHLFTFRWTRGAVFVTAIDPLPLVVEHAVESIRQILVFLKQHPECRRQDIVQSLCPGSAADSPEAAKLLSPLSWLIEKGHIIEFSSGALAAPPEIRQQEDVEPEPPDETASPVGEVSDAPGQPRETYSPTNTTAP